MKMTKLIDEFKDALLAMENDTKKLCNFTAMEIAACVAKVHTAKLEEAKKSFDNGGAVAELTQKVEKLEEELAAHERDTTESDRIAHLEGVVTGLVTTIAEGGNIKDYVAAGAKAIGVDAPTDEQHAAAAVATSPEVVPAPKEETGNGDSSAGTSEENQTDASKQSTETDNSNPTDKSE